MNTGSINQCANTVSSISVLVISLSVVSGCKIINNSLAGKAAFDPPQVAIEKSFKLTCDSYDPLPETWVIQPGLYKLEMSVASDKPPVSVDWIGSICEGARETRFLSVTCSMEKTGQLKVSCPRTFNYTTPLSSVTLKLSRLELYINREPKNNMSSKLDDNILTNHHPLFSDAADDKCKTTIESIRVKIIEFGNDHVAVATASPQLHEELISSCIQSSGNLRVLSQGYGLLLQEATDLGAGNTGSAKSDLSLAHDQFVKCQNDSDYGDLCKLLTEQSHKSLEEY